MKRMLRRFMILTGFFLAALVLYFFMNKEEKEENVSYSVMEEASLPIIYAKMCGRWMNPMHGHRRPMGNIQVRDHLTVLPADRALNIEIAGGSQRVNAIRYEVRSLDLERLVENTEVASWEKNEDGVTAVLPIQNLLAKNREYLLTIQLDTEQAGAVYYYTRIVWREQDDNIAASMVDLAAEFSRKTFASDEARDLVTYLETDPSEDNGSFAHTNIRSSFSQLTWGRLKMQPLENAKILLKELDGIMGCVVLEYPAVRMTDDGRQEYYEIEEAFTMKWNAQRIYMMDYERTVDQIAIGDAEDFSGKRIMLGIIDPAEIDVEYSPDRQNLVYRAGKDLWIYRVKDNKATRVFTFRNENMKKMQDNYGQHGEKILKVSDQGDIDFLVYGYQNRGIHEGETGVAGYHYSADDNRLEELFFAALPNSYEEIKQDLDRLSYCNNNDVLYLYMNHAVYSIDMKSCESMLIVDGLEEGSFAVSSDQSRIAWSEGGKSFEAHMLHLQNLENGEKMDIHSSLEDEYIRALGFVGNDLVYGFSKANTDWIRNGRRLDKPMYALEIRNDQMQIETRYEKQGYAIVDVDVDNSRVHLQRVSQIDAKTCVPAQEDTIVCNDEVLDSSSAGIGYYAAADKGRVYFVQLDEEIRDKQRIQIGMPNSVQTENSNPIELRSEYEKGTMEFRAYGAGKLLCRTGEFSSALNAAYGYMGYVTDQDGKILWNRVNRDGVANIRDLNSVLPVLEHHLKEFAYSRSYQDGSIFLDARGCSLMQLLYFIGQGCPLIGYTGEGEFVIIKGYDQYNVSIYDPVSGEISKLGLKDATEFFENCGNDFISVFCP